MVFRLSGAAPQTQAVNFDGASIQRAGQVASAGIGAGVQAVDGFMQQEAELFYQTEITDFNLGMQDDLRGIAETALGGEGYADAAGAAFDRRRSELLRRAGGNPYKAQLLGQHFEQVEATIRSGFQDEQRALAVDYGIASIGRQTDDAMQVASRSDYGLADLSMGTRAVNRAGNGITNISLDFNASPNGGARGTEVIVPDNAGPEIRAAADRFNSLMVEFAAKHGIDQPNRGVRNRSENGRGVSNTVHVEPFFNDNIALQDAINSDFDAFAEIYEKAFGGVEGVRIIPPHGVGADRGATSSVFGNETSFGERVVGRLMERRENGDGTTGPARDVNGIPVFEGEVPNVFDNPELSQRRSDIFAAINAIPGITANQRDELRRDAESNLTIAALGRMGEENAPATLAALRSGQYDTQLSYQQDQSIRRGLEADITRLEQDRTSQVRAGATGQAADYVAWNGNGRQGQAPSGLNQEQYLSLTPSQRAAYDQSDLIGEAIQGAQMVDLAYADEYIASLAPSGADYELEGEQQSVAAAEVSRRRAAAEAAQKVIHDRFVSDAAGLSLGERSAVLAGDLPDEVRGDIEAQQKAYLSALGSDQVALLRRNGVDVAPLDPENLLGSLQDRLSTVSLLASDNGVEPILTTPAERLQFTTIFDGLPLMDKVGLIAELGQDPEVSMQFFSEVSDQAPFLSYMGSFSNVAPDQDFMMVAMRGYEAGLSGATFKNDTNARLTEAMGTSNLGDALRGLPDVQAQVGEAALNYARGMSQNNGGDVAARDIENGLALALGGDNSIHRRNGSYYALPMGVQRREFRTWMNELTDADLQSQNGGVMPTDANGAPFTAEYIRDNGQLLTLGNGVYGIEFDDGSEVLGNSPSGRFLLRWGG